MAQLEDHLRATADELLSDLDRLKRLEMEKRALPMGDPRVAELSAAIERISQRTRERATAQREMAEEIQEDSSPR